MNWLLLTVLAVTARATYSLGTRLLGRDIHVSAQSQSFLLTAASGLLGLIVSPLLGGINFGRVNQNILPILFIIFTSVFGNIIYFKGQKLLDAGTTQIAFSSILIWGALLSVLFLGSKFSLLQLIGIFLMLGAVVLVQNVKRGFKLSSSVFFIIVSALSFAVFQVASASVSSVLSTGTYLVLSYFGTALVIFLMYARKIIEDFKKLTLQLKNTFLVTLLASGTSLLYLIFSYLAYRYAPDRGVVVVLLTAQVILSVIFGIFFLKEKENTAKKLFAGVLAFIAGVLIKS